tara:strand:- start:28871 stop:29713 length:843 start_codon:yes stop_codon:yes gene_type:complete
VFSVRPVASTDEIQETAIKWATNEGWNPGLNDAACFYQVNPNGIYLGLLDNDPISSISIISYDDTFAFLGLYIVNPEYQGQGYGLKTWQAAISQCHSATIALDAVLEQKNTYENSGFKFSNLNIRHHTKAQFYTPSTNTHHYKASDFSSVYQYDSNFFHAPRENFLSYWLAQSTATVILAKNGSQLIGYGVIRACLEGYKIGPLFADNPLAAENIFTSLVNTVDESSSIYIDVPENNSEALGLVDTFSMTPIFETARMYKGATPKIGLDKVYGITSLELG